MVPAHNTSPRQPAMIAVPLQAPALLNGAILCAVSLVASARPMQMKMPEMPKMPNLPKMPNFQLPNLPNLPNLPGQGKTEAQAKKAQAASAPPAASAKPTAGRVVPKVRVGAVKPPMGSEDAPTLAEVKGGQSSVKGLAEGSGWKQFPKKRIAGGSMDEFRKIARDIGPKF